MKVVSLVLTVAFSLLLWSHCGSGQSSPVDGGEQTGTPDQSSQETQAALGPSCQEGCWKFELGLIDPRGLQLTPEGSVWVLGVFNRATQITDSQGTSKDIKPVGLGTNVLFHIDSNGIEKQTILFGEHGNVGVHAMALHGDGHVIATMVRNNAKLFGTELTFKGYHAVVARRSSQGTLAWWAELRSNRTNPPTIHRVITGPEKNVYVCGEASSKLEFFSASKRDNAFTTMSASPNTAQGFVAKLSSSGDFQWVTPLTSRGFSRCVDIAVNKDKTVHLTGEWSGKLTGLASPVDSVNLSMFVGKLDADGKPVWQATSTSSNSKDKQHAGRIAVAEDGTSVVVGHYQTVDLMNKATATFGSTTLQTIGKYDGYIAKVTPDGTWKSAQSVGVKEETYDSRSGSGTTRIQTVTRLKGIGMFDQRIFAIGEFDTRTPPPQQIITSVTKSDVLGAALNRSGGWLAELSNSLQGKWVSPIGTKGIGNPVWMGLSKKHAFLAARIQGKLDFGSLTSTEEPTKPFVLLRIPHSK